MKIVIKATNIKLTSAIRDYVDNKIGSLEKFLKNIDQEIIEARVEVGMPSQHHRQGEVFDAEANINCGGHLFRAKASTNELYASIDKIKDDLQREIRRHKEKQITMNRRLGRSFKKARALSPMSRFKK